MTRPVQRSEWAFKSRIYIGQIASVDEESGTCEVRVGGIHDKLKAIIPMAGLSVNKSASSWSRYMPCVGDFVQCGYGPHNSLEILGATAYGANITDSTGSASAGNTAMRVRNEGYARIARAASTNEQGMRVFRKLRQGEFDARSAGGAGHYATREGFYIIEAGRNTLSMSKQDNELRGRSDLFSMGGGGTELRFGVVKRKDAQTDANEGAVLPNTGAAVAPKELRIKVGYTVPVTGIDLSFADFHAGDLRDSFGAPILVGPLRLLGRYRMRCYDPSGLVDLAGYEVDIAGNTRIRTLTTLTLHSDLPVGGVFIGKFGNIEPYVKGLTWTVARALQHTTQGAAWGAEGAANTTFATAGVPVMVAATAAAIAALTGPPPAPPPSTAAAVAAIMTTWMGAFTAYLAAELIRTTAVIANDGAQAAAVAAFEAGSASYLSLKIFGE